MSLFRKYTPRSLYVSTLQLVNSLFHVPPPVTSSPSSYLKEVLQLHCTIRADLNGILTNTTGPTEATTIQQIHSSITLLEQQLFGTDTTFNVDIAGCCLHTQHLEQRLNHPQSCLLQ